jgi:hypothetical protein
LWDQIWRGKWAKEKGGTMAARDPIVWRLNAGRRIFWQVVLKAHCVISALQLRKAMSPKQNAAILID